MAKLTSYIIIIVGVILLLNIAGLPTLTSVVLDWIGIVDIDNIHNFSATAFYVAIGVALGLLITVSGIRISIIGSLPTTSVFAAAGLAIPMVFLVGDLTSIIILTNTGGTNWAGMLTFLIVAPLMVGYLLALFDWARGQDN